MRLVIFIVTLTTAIFMLPRSNFAQTIRSVQGVVVEADKGLPLEGVSVSAVSSGYSYQALTDSAGHFTVDVPPGRYFFRPARNGMVYSRPAALKFPSEPGVWVELSSEPVQDVELRMSREAVITGQVMDSNGKVFPGTQAKVDLFRSGYDEHGKRKLISVPVVTDTPECLGAWMIAEPIAFMDYSQETTTFLGASVGCACFIREQRTKVWRSPSM